MLVDQSQLEKWSISLNLLVAVLNLSRFVVMLKRESHVSNLFYRQSRLELS